MNTEDDLQDLLKTLRDDQEKRLREIAERDDEQPNEPENPD